MFQLYHDIISIITHFKKSNLFVTFTYNPKWSEVIRELLPYQITADRSDLTAHVFHQKLQKLLKDLYEKHYLDMIIAYIYIIEFQKRDLFHTHILLILASESKLQSAANYDSIISTKIPDLHNISSYL